MRKFLGTVLIFSLILAFTPGISESKSGSQAEPRSGLTLDEKIGQLMIVGFQGTDLDHLTAAHFQKIKPGAFLLFSRNIVSPVQVYHLNKKLQRSSKNLVPALIALDQEGGIVNRIPTTPALPSPRAIGKSKNLDLARAFGEEIGLILRSVGFNMNLAPVLDVTKELQWDFIGSRSYGHSPQEVAASGRAFAEGLLLSGVLPTAKHFPGSGGLDSDPHHKSSWSLSDKNSFLATQLAPFKQFADLYPSSVMLSHVRYPSLDSSGLPATYSPEISSNLLRKNLNFRGLVVTDDLLMDGAKIYKNIGDAAVAAVNAGADLVMVSWSRKDQLRVFNSLKAAVTSGKISAQALEQKVTRILSVKRLLATHPKPPKSPHWTSPRLASLEQGLLLENLAADLKLSQKLKQSDNVIVMARHSLFAEQLRRVLKRPLKFVKNKDQLKAALKKDPKAVAIILSSDKRTSLMLDGLPLATKKQLLVVSTATPGPRRDPAYWGQVYTYYMHPKLGWELGRSLTLPPPKVSQTD